MEWMLWVLGAAVFVFWGLPLLKYILSRLWVYVRLVMLCVTRRAFVVFRHPFSLWAFHRSRHADVLVVCDRYAYLVKFGGSFKRATHITATTPTAWVQERLWRSVGPMSAPMMVKVFTRTITIPFDTVDDTVRLRAAVHHTVLLEDTIPVYMLTPKPLSLSVVENGVKRPLSNGEELFGMTLYTAKRFFKHCRTRGKTPLTRDEKHHLKNAFRCL